MLKQNKNQNNQIFRLLGICIIFIIYICFTLVSYSDEMRLQITGMVEKDMQSEAKKIADGYQKEIDAVSQTAHIISVLLSEENQLYSQNSMDMLQEAVDSSQAVDAYIMDMAGNAVDVAGNPYMIDDDEEITKAKSGVLTVSPIQKSADSVYYMNVYSPIISDTKVKGIVCLKYPADQLARFVDNRDKNIYTIAAPDGQIAAEAGKSGPEKDSDIFEYVDNSTEFKSDFNNTSYFGMNVTTAGINRYVVRYPILENMGSVIVFYNGSYFDQMVRKSYIVTSDMVNHIIGAVILFVIAIIIMFIISHILENKRSSLLENKADTDLLTGALNKISTERYITEYLEGDGRTVSGMLFLFDVDNFKKVNDTMGHAFGDQVLATLGIRLRNLFRASDYIGRIGGDEFIVFVKNVGDETIRQKQADKVIGFFKDFQVGDYVKYSVTTSIGVACYPEDGKTFKELYKAADKGVYLSKSKGKNALSFYSETK